MSTNQNPVPVVSALMLILATALVAGCAPAQFTHQRDSAYTGVVADQAAAVSQDPSPRHAVPAISQVGLVAPHADWGELPQANRPSEFPAPLAIRDTAVDQTTDVAQRTVLRVSTSTFDRHVLASEVPVLVDFYADWCGPCKALAPTLEQVAKENPQARVVKVNIDDSPELAARYGVRSVPRLMVFKNGQIAAQQNGVAGKTRLNAMLGLSAPVSVE
jgi:thioredoxin 1